MTCIAHYAREQPTMKFDNDNCIQIITSIIAFFLLIDNNKMKLMGILCFIVYTTIDMTMIFCCSCKYIIQK